MPGYGDNPLSVAMEKLGLRAPFRDNGPVVYEGPSERTAGAPKRSQLAKEEALLERMIVSIINSKQWDKLQPNSGNSVEIGDAHVCVNYHEEETMRCRMWEWQGHIIVYDDTKGYVPEYVYGNHMEILQEELAEELRRMLSAGFGGFGAQPFWNAK